MGKWNKGMKEYVIKHKISFFMCIVALGGVWFDRIDE